MNVSSISASYISQPSKIAASAPSGSEEMQESSAERAREAAKPQNEANEITGLQPWQGTRVNTLA